MKTKVNHHGLHGFSRIKKNNFPSSYPCHPWFILLFLIYFALAIPSHAQNVNAKIKNPADQTISVGDPTNGLKVQVMSAAAPASVTSAPGATPSPSPAKALGVQGTGTANAALPILTLPKQFTGVPSTFTIGTADATVFTLAAGEIGFIQNLDDAALAVKKGASASTTSLSFILAAGTAADDGKGGAVRIDDFVGAVSVAAMSGSPRFIAWKQAP